MTDEQLKQVVSDAWAQLSARFGARAISTIRHKESGRFVAILGVALREHDLAPLVNYQCEAIVFSRPLDEFLERFEVVTGGGQ